MEPPSTKRHWGVLIFGLVWVLFVFGKVIAPGKLLSPLVPLKPIEAQKGTQEVFGFIPHWNINKTESLDFETLTTLAYFGVPVKENGNLDRDNPGYKVFISKKATGLFKKAHAHGTRVVLTLTLMDNSPIKHLLDDPEHQENAVRQAVAEVEQRGIDGINVDFEYVGNPPDEYRQNFTNFVEKLTKAMHQKNPSSQVTVSVYAASAKEPKLYDIEALAKPSDGIFMMAYDFAAWRAGEVMPTAPLFGYKEGKYWYDVSTAVEDFLKVMAPGKLILGLPWYGYDYPVYEPAEKAETHKGYSYWYKYWYRFRGRLYWRWRKGLSKPPVKVQTYAKAQEKIEPEKEGWDEQGKVGWKAYKDGNTWRMTYVEDERSLGHKYDFAKEKNLAGVGIWALGFEEENKELWQQLRNQFTDKKKDFSLVDRVIAGGEDDEL